MSETIFLVDDDAAVLKAVSRLLRAKGYAVAAFSSAQEFVDHYEPSWSGCVVLDLSMPGISGLELQRWLAARNSSLSVLFLTGSDELLREGDSMKPTIDILMKPITGSAFISAVEKALSRIREARNDTRT